MKNIVVPPGRNFIFMRLYLEELYVLSSPFYLDKRLWDNLEQRNTLFSLILGTNRCFQSDNICTLCRSPADLTHCLFCTSTLPLIKEKIHEIVFENTSVIHSLEKDFREIFPPKRNNINLKIWFGIHDINETYLHDYTDGIRLKMRILMLKLFFFLLASIT